MVRKPLDRDGAGLAPSSGMARTVGELVAYQFAITFKEEVYRLIRESPPARRDFEYRGQIEGALSGIDGNIAEGFGRRRATDFANFLVYALGSIAEARARLQDGILRGHFAAADCATAFAWAGRCTQITRSLRESQLRLIEQDRAARAKPRRPARPVRPRRSPPRPARPAAKPEVEDLQEPEDLEPEDFK
jgi:four helix bundle protein